MKVVVTGHRPNKLHGYNIHHPGYAKLSNEIYFYLGKKGDVDCVSGMSQGIDMVYALTVIRYRKDYPNRNIKLECAVPCPEQPDIWPPEARVLYFQILKQADKVTYVNDHYFNSCMQLRNIYMIDLLTKEEDRLLAVWDGSNGGTGNTVNYASKKNKIIDVLNPQTGIWSLNNGSEFYMLLGAGIENGARFRIELYDNMITTRVSKNGQVKEETIECQKRAMFGANEVDIKRAEEIKDKFIAELSGEGN